MAKQEFSIPALMQRLTSEAAAYELLEQLRWNGTPVCPHCGTIDCATYIRPLNGVSRRTRTGTQSERRVWKCNACLKQFTVLVGTIFHGSKIPVRTWVLVILEMVASKNGVAAREIERKYDLTNKSAWFMLHRIREAMKRDPLAGLLSGTVVADETWIGGAPANRHRKDVNKPGETDKSIVLSLVHKESGEVRSRVVPNVTADTLRDAIHEEVHARKTTLHTDGFIPYPRVAEGMAGHDFVSHNAGEYVRGDVSTNAAESYFSQLKRSVDGTHHHVSVEHLARYVAQHDFLRSTHRLDDSDRMRLLVEKTGGRRLTYRPLKAR